MMLFALMAVLTANATDYYLTGNFNSWGKSDNCKFTETSESGVLTLTYDGTLTSGFKIYDGADWSTVDIGASASNTTLVVGEAYSYVASGKNFTLAEPIANPTLTLDINNGTLTLAGQTAQVTVTYKLNGSFEDGSAWNDVALTENNGTFSATVEAKVDAAFKVVTLNDGKNGDWLGADNASIAADADNQTISLSTTGGNISIAKGTYNMTVKAENGTVTLTVSAASATGISSVKALSSKNAPAYNLAGQRVANDAKGLVIVGGKKILKK